MATMKRSQALLHLRVNRSRSVYASYAPIDVFLLYGILHIMLVSNLVTFGKLEVSGWVRHPK